MSDTRREDVIDRVRATLGRTSESDEEVVDAVLAVLPAPPVVDEAEIGALLRSHHAAPADALEARMGMRNGCTCGGPGLAVDHQAAAVAAHLRGATRG